MTEKKWNYTYKITNKVNGMYYYGCHSTNNLADNYKGGSRKVWSDIEKYGEDNFEIEWLEKFDTSEEKFKAEEKLITLNIINDPMSYNQRTGGNLFKSKGSKLSNEMKDNIGKFHKEKIISKDTRLKISDSLKGKKYENRKRKSDKDKEKLKESLKDKWKELEYSINVRLGMSKGIYIYGNICTPFVKIICKRIDAPVSTIRRYCVKGIKGFGFIKYPKDCLNYKDKIKFCIENNVIL